MLTKSLVLILCVGLISYGMSIGLGMLLVFLKKPEFDELLTRVGKMTLIASLITFLVEFYKGGL